MNINITSHAKRRIYQRKKLKKNPLQDDVKKAWYRGIPQYSNKPGVEEITSRFDKEVRIYDNFIYLFDVDNSRATLITILYLPKKYRGIQNRKKKASKNYINRKI